MTLLGLRRQSEELDQLDVVGLFGRSLGLLFLVGYQRSIVVVVRHVFVADDRVVVVVILVYFP